MSKEFYSFLENTKDQKKAFFNETNRVIARTIDLSGFLVGDAAPILREHNNGKILEVDNFLRSEEVTLFLERIQQQPWSKMVYKPTLTSTTKEDGGYCVRWYDIDLSKRLWDRVKANLIISKEGFTAVGMNPFMRVHTQGDGNFLKPHVDTDLAYQFSNKYTTQKSILIYFTDNTSGALSFIDTTTIDEETDKYLDKDYVGPYGRLNIFPSKGKLLVFNSELLHCVTQIIGETRISLVGEIVYSKD
jgi:hypothetical protein